ncbi:hypothetical protein [Aureliella helgolandensis]|uniref:Uncharacterized protein n=1 Tax=Aureliella helgolandensis TaxID=2527968 RepID=A0A518G685_9BACT|nr:hypothetical protein [Aureliella helgolandensis]QDV24097.1 hypothetical protein Q31a_24100 [Aureliella helgolandensis]
MAGELERFLEQAARRLAEKIEQSQNPGRPAPRPRPQPTRQQERQRLDPDIVDAEIVEAKVVSSNPRELGPDRLSKLDTRKKADSDVDQADERMSSHLHDVFDQDDVMHLQKDAHALKPESNTRSSRSSVKHETSPGEVRSTQGNNSVQRRNRSVSPMIEILRQPETLRAAFIAGEIFRPKF